jgi:hypothetical protein
MGLSLRPRPRWKVGMEAMLETKKVVYKQIDISFVSYCGTICGIAKPKICALHHEFL